MDTLVIEIGAEGKVSAMHTDKFDLGFLGDKKVRRQTEIVFNESTQLWDIEYLTSCFSHITHTHLSGFSGYEAAREFEVLWVNNCRLHRLDPESYLGIAYAGYLRFGPTEEEKCFTLPDGSCIADICMHTKYPSRAG